MALTTAEQAAPTAAFFFYRRSYRRPECTYRTGRAAVARRRPTPPRLLLLATLAFEKNQRFRTPRGNEECGIHSCMSPRTREAECANEPREVEQLRVRVGSRLDGQPLKEYFVGVGHAFQKGALVLLEVVRDVCDGLHLLPHLVSIVQDRVGQGQAVAGTKLIVGKRIADHRGK
eukprot:5635246-Prymnesium_polylepis.1